METTKGYPVRHIDAQAGKEFLVSIWLELLEWGETACNSAARFFTALFNIIMLCLAVVIAALAVVVLIMREQITKPSEASAIPLISIKTFFKKT